ncbi:50S ribosomal protein L19e [Candidatus Woesearchaeota archaeon]|nr:50S ribosomal protein L19e [Candidatus Woesearchaeota archaeon]
MKNLKVQKRLASQLLKRSKKKIALDTSRLEDVKEAITKKDIKSLIKDGAIVGKQKTGVSRARANHRHIQKTKGQRKGHGKRKGKVTARMPKKESWMKKIRLQRAFLTELKSKGLLTTSAFRSLYLKSKGGFFRSKRHIKLFITEHKIINDNNNK